MCIAGAERARIHRAYRETDLTTPLNLPEGRTPGSPGKGDRRPKSLMQDHSRPATSVVEVDPLGRRVFAMWIAGAERARIHRAYRETDLPVPLNLP